jgi:hypothetical protein
MAAGIYNFTIEQGATFTRIFKYKDSEGNPIQLGEASALRMQIRESIDDESPIPGGEFTSASGGFFLSSSVGQPSESAVKDQFTLIIPASTSSNFNFDRAVYDIELVDGNTTTRLLQGKIKLSKEVTR